VGTDTPTNLLSVAGNANFTGNVTLGDASTDTVTVNGNMGVGDAASSDVGVFVRNTALTSASQYGVLTSPTGTSSGTTRIVGVRSSPKPEAASFTVTDVIGYWALEAAKGAGSTITNQHGIVIGDQTQGTNNYGITSLVSSGTDKWNIYASGTAANYFAGNVGIGTNSPDGKLHVLNGSAGTVTANGNADELVVENSSTGGLSILTPDVSTGYIIFGSPSDNEGAIIRYNQSGALMTIGTEIANGQLAFRTAAGTERARITAGGYSKFSNAGTYVGSTSSYHEFRQTANETTLWLSNTNGSLSGTVRGIRMQYDGSAPNDTSNYFLYCDDGVGGLRAGFRSNGGLANYQSNNADLSDERTKKDITPAPSYWDKIGALEIVTYKYNDQTHDDVNVGVIAQQVEAVESVWVDSDGFGETPEGEEPLKTVYTKDITFAAIKALQEAMARIEALEAEVAALKGAN
jgi:hypothetical protein